MEDTKIYTEEQRRKSHISYEKNFVTRSLALQVNYAFSQQHYER